jgi:mannose-6-phosphate isomerase-like protein (cupin superfamily)
MLRRIFLSISLVALQPLFAQTIHTARNLQQSEARLKAAAHATPTGVAHETLDDFGTYRTLLIVRVHTGPPERHQLWADQMIVNKGTLTLITGGTMQGEHPNGTDLGETLATSIQGGKEVILHPGDIVHIPVNVPHWVKLAPGATTTYLIVKEK